MPGDTVKSRQERWEQKEERSGEGKPPGHALTQQAKPRAQEDGAQISQSPTAPKGTADKSARVLQQGRRPPSVTSVHTSIPRGSPSRVNLGWWGRSHPPNHQCQCHSPHVS